MLRSEKETDTMNWVGRYRLGSRSTLGAWCNQIFSPFNLVPMKLLCSSRCDVLLEKSFFEVRFRSCELCGDYLGIASAIVADLVWSNSVSD